MERITPENETLVGFFDLDGDPNEGHENDGKPVPIVGKPSDNPPAAEGEGEETVIDMTTAADVPEETPAEEQPPAEEEKSTEEEKPEELAAAEQTEKKKTPWQRNDELKKELAEQKRVAEEAEQRRQAAERIVQEQQQRLTAIEGYLQKQAAEAEQARKVAQPQEPKVEIPPYEENPLENLRGELTLTQQIIKEANERAQRLEQQTIVQQFEGRIDKEEAVYAQQKPHYYEARNYLIESAWKEGRAMGMSDQQITDTIQAYRVQFARTAWSANKPIAEIVEQVAMQRGYQPKQAPIAEQNDPQEQPKPEAREKVRNAVAREQQASSSLATASRTNGRPPVKLTKDVVMRMTEEDMERMDRENPGWMEKYMQEQ